MSEEAGNLNHDHLAEILNYSYSRCSSSASESDLSLSLMVDRELDAYSSSRLCDSDELPAFEIRLISPHGRTPSPIDSEVLAVAVGTPQRHSDDEHDHQPASSPHPRYDNTNINSNSQEFVALHEINAQISPPSDGEEALSRTSSLETIFEGVFLSTPPRRQRCSARHSLRTRTNLIEKVALNRLNMTKEKHSIFHCEAIVSTISVGPEQPEQEASAIAPGLETVTVAVTAGTTSNTTSSL